MPKLPTTLAEIAEAASVSIAAVSKALSPHADRCDLKPQTRDRIIAIAKELGWSRNRRRSSRARRRYHNIGVLWGTRVPQFGSYEHVADTLSETLGENTRLLIAPVPKPSDWKVLQQFMRLDGVIGLGQLHDGILADLEQRDYPVVLVNETTTRRLHQVLANDRAGCTAIMQHLLGLGHRHIVYLRNPWEPAHYSEIHRLAAIRAAASAAACRLEEVLGPLYDQVVAHCRSGATAIICQQFSHAADLLLALRAAGIRVPQQASIVICHDLSWFRTTDPPLTAVTVPLRQMAEIGAKLLLELIAGKSDETLQRLVLDESLVVRASTGRPPRAKSK